MFKKILIANRGEIACRIVRTARQMGVQTVAVYSDADKKALHVQLADEAFHIGPAAVRDSYLRGDRIIAAANAAGAEAVHPGYGFLSENPDFVAGVEAAGLKFIGPSADAIRAMGLKDGAKTLMEKAGVPVVPGYHGDDQSEQVLRDAADRLGYPVLIKARAGGGGKGMRYVAALADFSEALEGARREASASFGDDRVLVEKFIASPRHIEVQVFGDEHGNVVHLFERDCSLQRRHQKVIEEAPAPGMTAEMRAAMGEAACKAARAIGYSGAGTVEFIADATEGLHPERFYFMEMNTRLQVEHPVTEFITGLDLVNWQLRVAAGEPLAMAQAELSIKGWALEARLYAEDPGNEFLPATGRLEHLRFPGPPVRVDTGVCECDEITPHYDPMIAKVIVHGDTRDEALGRLGAALAETEIAGTTTNLAFLSNLVADDDVCAGFVDTGLIARKGEILTVLAEPRADIVALAVLEISGVLENLRTLDTSRDPWDRLIGWRHWGGERQTVRIDMKGDEVEARLSVHGSSGFAVEMGDDAVLFCDVSVAGPEVRYSVSGRRRAARCFSKGPRTWIFADGATFVFTRPDVRRADVEDHSGDQVVAPMPGSVRRLFVKPSATVVKGEALAVLEAMKMEHTLRAPRDGQVSEVLVEENDQVEMGAILIALGAAVESDAAE